MNMSRNPLIAVIFLSCFLIFSCSSDDEDIENPQFEKNYFPLVLDNSWDYKNTVSTQNQDDLISQETLTLNNISQVGGNTVYEFETSNPVNSAPTTLALSNGFVYKNGTSLFYTGYFGLGTPDFPNINFEVEDGKIYDKNLAEGTEMFSFQDSLQENFNGVPIIIDYTVSSVMGSTLQSLVITDEAFDDVITSKLIVNMEVFVDGIPLPILENQKVIEVTNYFAEDVGLIKSEIDANFNFISFPTIPLEDINFFILQELENYSLNIE